METVENPSAVLEPAPACAIRRSFFRDVPWRWRDLLFCFGPDVIFPLARPLLPVALLIRWQSLWLPSMLLGDTWLIGYTLWAARQRYGALPGLPKLRRVLAEARWLLALVPASQAVMFGVYAVAAAALADPGPPSEGWAPVARSATHAELAGLAFMAVTVAPIAEELAFRGLLYNKLRQALPTSLALVLQAVAFGLVHYPLGREFACAITAVGVVIGLFYEWRKTLVAPILLHASANVIGCAMVMAYVTANAGAPRLGVFVEAGERGAVVTMVAAGGTADHAGIKAGDIVTALDGTAVRNFREVSAIVRRKRAGDSITIDFTRDGVPQRVQAVLTPLPVAGRDESRGQTPIWSSSGR
jgi:membrane protease YdiL (CAAX protease family)